MAIKAVIFDCFGVLVVDGKDTLRHDFPDHVQEIHDTFLRSDYGYISGDEQTAQLADITGLSVDELEARYKHKNVLNQSVLAWVRQVKDDGLAVGLLSNIRRDGLEEFFPQSDRELLFDAEVLSGEVGMTKPSVRIFEMMAERLKLDPSECVMIDDLLKNTDGAERAGMHGILFDTVRQAQAELARIVSEHA
jgi:epoxide hydrolase-like predicted phosphatase